MIAGFDDMCRAHGHPISGYSQVKEKFGSLRVYHLGDEYSHDLELAAARLSVCVCEICGRPGKLRGDGGWWATRCDDHAGEPV